MLKTNELSPLHVLPPTSLQSFQVFIIGGYDYLFCCAWNIGFDFQFV